MTSDADSPEPREQLLSAGEVAELLGVTPRTLRFYETKGLLRPRRVGSRRVYDYRDRARLELILRGKRLGFALADIRKYLELYDADRSQLAQLERLAVMIAERLDTLLEQREALGIAIAELHDIREQVHAALDERGVDPASLLPETGRPGTGREEVHA